MRGSKGFPGKGAPIPCVCEWCVLVLFAAVMAEDHIVGSLAYWSLELLTIRAPDKSVLLGP